MRLAAEASPRPSRREGDLTWIVVDVKVDKIVVDDLHDITVLADEIGKAETPRAPVATNLTNNKLLAAIILNHSKRLVNLLHRIDFLIIYFLQTCLCIY